MKLLIYLVLICLGFQTVFAQANCDGKSLFIEKKCAGDEVSASERELFRIINEYREENKLPPIALSDQLSLVANRHLIDLGLNLKYLTHGWSNCPYDIKKESTWDCVFSSPQRLGTNYTGRGFENLYRNMTGSAAPALALEAWKKSPMHNNLILNQDIWKNRKFDAFGIAISGNFAAMWFGSKDSGDVEIDQKVEGLGVSFQELVKGLTTILSIQKEASLAESEKWVGSSADKTIRLEIHGSEKDIAQTTMSLSLKLLKNGELTPQSRAALSQFLKNVAEKWSDRDQWMDAAIQKIGKTPGALQTINISNRTIEVKNNVGGKLTVLVKPVSKQTPKNLPREL